MLAFMVVGFIRGDLVPGWIYRAMVTRAEKAESISEGAIGAVKTVAETVKAARDDRPRTPGR